MVVQKETRSVIAKLNQKHQQEFFNAVQERFVTACDYIRPKFPLKDVARINAEVVELRAVDRMSFQKVLFFCGALPSHVGPTDQQQRQSRMEALNTQEMELQLQGYDMFAVTLRQE